MANINEETITTIIHKLKHINPGMVDCRLPVYIFPIEFAPTEIDIINNSPLDIDSIKSMPFPAETGLAFLRPPRTSDTPVGHPSAQHSPLAAKGW